MNGYPGLRGRLRRPDPRGLATAFLKTVLALVGVVGIAAQLSVLASVARGPATPSWDGVQTWFQAERIRNGEALYRPLPSYGPHVMAIGMEGFEPFPIDNSPHLPLPAALVALAPAHSLETFRPVMLALLALAIWGFASVLAILAHGAWTVPRFLWWHGVIFLTPYAHFTFRLGNIEPVLWFLFALAVALSARATSAVLVVSAAIKPYAVWPLAFSLARRREAWRTAVLAAGAVLAVCVLAMGPLPLLRHARDWLAYVPAAIGQGTFHHDNLSLSFGVLRAAYRLGWWDYQPGPIVEAWPRIWLTVAQVAGPLATGLATRRWDLRFHLSAVLLAALLFSPLCWGSYLVVALVPVAVGVGLVGAGHD